LKQYFTAGMHLPTATNAFKLQRRC